MGKFTRYRNLYDIEPILTGENFIQGQEQFWVKINNDNIIKLEIWEYGRMYEHPFLYDIIYNDIVKLNAPINLIDYFLSLLDKLDTHIKLRVLDLGAGSGLAAEHLKKSGRTELIIGVDILNEAKEAALRDRKLVYDDYFIMNFENLSTEQIVQLSTYNFNCFFVVSATGGGDDDSDYEDVMLKAYMQAVEILEPFSFIVFNIREKRTTGQKLIMDYLTTCCNIIGTKIHPFRQLIDGREFNAEFVIFQLK